MILNRLIKENAKTPSLILPYYTFPKQSTWITEGLSAFHSVLLAFVALNQTFQIIYIRFF